MQQLYDELSSIMAIVDELEEFIEQEGTEEGSMGYELVGERMRVLLREGIELVTRFREEV